ncbi:hypothetical protein PSACC_02228 [Paramicrosporidium saccamoebae]|uniref:NodB homology domain-containing protein n=1 Tax=Paramicrosporidium saccamoebae TaxID=1246581 RepID=A0A2H9TJL6_9FUNG|nr:hypothetical protein PSACC_02228 [Paramicrosporidium saccamoebae]
MCQPKSRCFNYTAPLLDTLEKLKVRVTFFILGQTIAEYLDIEKKNKNYHYRANRRVLRRMIESGHDVGSHTFDHSILTSLTDQQILQQMDSTSDLFNEVANVRPAFMRAPEGYRHFNRTNRHRCLSLRVLRLLKDRGYTPVHWFINPEDWSHALNDPDHMVKYIQDELPKASRGKGEIILQHDTNERTALKDQVRIIKLIQKKGRKLVTMGVCLGQKPYKKNE